MITVVVAGEGKTELGGLAAHPPYRAASPDDGVVVALLRVLEPDLHVQNGKLWRELPKLRVGEGSLADAEFKNVRKLAVWANGEGAQVLAFVRDTDGDVEREQAIERGLESLGDLALSVRVAGGCAERCLEAWLLALAGVTNTESLSAKRAKADAESRGLSTTAEKVAHVQQHGRRKLAADADRLHQWIIRAEAAIDAGRSAP